ncbi:MAG TPA: ABC transporter permease [Candidatus Eisenbacteria bacterium]|nr:ABC transporter permease [Candidatus Eisenbacteria bacterium]
MNALTVASASLRRLVRDRTAMFFVVLLPIVVIVIIGATVGRSDRFRIGVVSHDHRPLATDLVTALRDSPATDAKTYEDEDSARTAVRRGELDAVVVVPARFDADLRAGRAVAVPVIGGGATGNEQAARSAVAAVVAAQAARVQAARFATRTNRGDLEGALQVATRLQSTTPAVTVRTEVVGGGSQVLPAGFGYSAPTMLVLFVFINALASGGAVIQTRRLGIYDRVLAAPVRARDVVLGETLCYFTLAMLQSLLIVGIGALLFGVSWGDPLAAATLVLAWALLGTGAGMLSGTVFRTPEQATAIGPAVGVALGMLGGCMWPLAIVTPVMRTIGHLSPHAWAVEAWTTLLSRGGHLPDIVVPLAVIGAVAAVLLAVATLRMRRQLTG